MHAIDILIWTLFFYFSNIYFAGNLQVANYVVATFIVILLLILYRSKSCHNKKSYDKIDKVTLSLWIILAVTIFITNIINNDNIIHAIALNTLIPYFFIFRIRYYKAIDDIILKSILFSSGIILLNIIGMFNPFLVNININTNSMGIYLMFLSIYTFYKYYFLDRYMLLVFINLILVALTNSRTAFISFSISMLVIMILKLKNTNKTKKLVNIMLVLLILILTIIMLLLFKDKIIEIEIFQKFIMYSSQDNSFNGRNKIWIYIVDNANFKGHNMNALSGIFNLSPHSNYLGILYANGIIAFFAFVVLNIRMLNESIKRFKYDNKNIFNVVILMVFLLTSITEYYFNALGISIVYLWFICLGKLMFHNQIEETWRDE